MATHAGSSGATPRPRPALDARHGYKRGVLAICHKVRCSQTEARSALVFAETVVNCARRMNYQPVILTYAMLRKAGYKQFAAAFAPGNNPETGTAAWTIINLVLDPNRREHTLSFTRGGLEIVHVYRRAPSFYGRGDEAVRSLR